MRLLVFGDPLSPREAAEVLGTDLRDPLLDAGLLAHRGLGLASLFPITIAGGLYLLSDDLTQGGDAVMGPSDATANLCRAARPSVPVKRTLDVGCGAGAVGLVLARGAESVVATDINPRALALARINAALNGIGNVEFRLGDCFAPVRGETFDLIVSQPPFVPRPPHSLPAAYLYGGPRGDELPMRIVAGVGEHLAPRGRAVLMVEWPETDGIPVEGRISPAAGIADARFLHLRFSSGDPDFHCAMYAGAESPELGEAFECRVRLWRDHFEAQGIHSLRTVCTVIERDPDRPPWSATVDLPAEETELNAASIDRGIAAHDLVHAERAALLAAELRMPATAVISKEYTPEDAKPRYFVRLDESAAAVELGEDALLLLSLVHEEPTVAQAIAKFAAHRSLDACTAEDRLLPVVEQALRAGIIESSRPKPSSTCPENPPRSSDT